MVLRLTNKRSCDEQSFVGFSFSGQLPNEAVSVRGYSEYPRSTVGETNSNLFVSGRHTAYGSVPHSCPRSGTKGIVSYSFLRSGPNKYGSCSLSSCGTNKFVVYPSSSSGANKQSFPKSGRKSVTFCHSKGCVSDQPPSKTKVKCDRPGTIQTQVTHSLP